jgi:hypothetical protein
VQFFANPFFTEAGPPPGEVKTRGRLRRGPAPQITKNQQRLEETKMAKKNFELFVDHCNLCTRWPCSLCGSDWDKKGGQPILRVRDKATKKTGDICDSCARRLNENAVQVFYELETKLTEFLRSQSPCLEPSAGARSNDRPVFF